MALAPAPQPRTFLAFDFGTRRVGVASGNTLTNTATPLATIELAGERRFAAIAALIAEWQPAALVVGVPLHPDGAAHANTLRARRFGREIAARSGLPVHEVDERYSTTAAVRKTLTPTLSRKRERESAPTGFRKRERESAPTGFRKREGATDIDARAAAIILEQYLAGGHA